MDLSTYNGLKAAVAEYLNREDLTAQIPVFVALAETKFNRDIRVLDMMKLTRADVDDGFFSLPADYLQTHTLRLVTPSNAKLEFVSLAEMNEHRIGSSSTRTPGRYTMVGNKFMLEPSPATEITLELAYFAKTPALSATNPTNWLLTRHPDLYLYGTLLEAEPFLKNDERTAVWDAGRQAGLEAVRMEDERARRPSGALNATRRSFG